MDIHPPARRPHKSPAHTVKDHRIRPQRRVPCSPPKWSSEPHILQQIPSPSTPCEHLFLLHRFVSGPVAVSFSGSVILQQVAVPSTGRSAADPANARSDASLGRVLCTCTIALGRDIADLFQSVIWPRRRNARPVTRPRGERARTYACPPPARPRSRVRMRIANPRRPRHRCARRAP